MTDPNVDKLTPPPELIEDWILLAKPLRDLPPDPNAIATQAARWGADTELEACCEWLADDHTPVLGQRLRAARRPKPPSLKEQALAELELLRGDANAHGLGFDAPNIRAALERLQQLEQLND
jgi:hypothetical protein